jgi:hypothetical protein
MVRPKRRWIRRKWWLYLRLLFTYLESWGQKRGPTGGRQPGVGMDHTSYHLHMPAHLPVIHK